MADESAFEVSSNDPGGFDSLACESDNGGHFWWQSDLMTFLGYQTDQAFRKPVGKAMAAVSTLGLSTLDSFTPARRVVDGAERSDCRLTRFACYLIAMNGDPHKPEVAVAQAYFAAMTEVARQAMVDSDSVERLVVRDEVSGAEKALSSTAKAAGVTRFDVFRNEGYRGMYNMPLNQLKARKGVDVAKVLFDYMGKQELAANLFRVTETEAKIRKDGIKGERHVEQTAFQVGRVVRQTMIQTSGTVPEDLPVEADIHKVRSSFKKTAKGFEKKDGPKKLSRRPDEGAE